MWSDLARIYIYISWSSGWMKTDADKAIQMMTCPTETTSLISWPLVSASASSFFRSDRTGCSLNYASKCLTNTQPLLLVNCRIFRDQFGTIQKCAIFHIRVQNRRVPVLKSSSPIGSPNRHGIFNGPITFEYQMSTREVNTNIVSKWIRPAG